jgi:hypothetical protein
MLEWIEKRTKLNERPKKKTKREGERKKMERIYEVVISSDKPPSGADGIFIHMDASNRPNNNV